MKKNRIYITFFIILAATAAVLYLTNSNSTIKEELRDFAVKDTSSIDKIFMADRKGGTVSLERKSPGSWTVNGRFDAREDGMNTLLTTIAGMEVRSPVGKNLYNNTMKLLASNSVKVEVYSKGELLKTFYVGHPTMDNLGTFMYLEGSSVPFIMHVPGFNGYLTPRFFVSENGWRKRVLYTYQPNFIKSVTVSDPLKIDSTFTLSMINDTSYSVTSGNGESVQPLRMENVIKYLIGFRSVAYEVIDDKMTQGLKDSLLRAGPFKKIAIASVDGKTKEASCYRRPLVETSLTQTDAAGNRLPFDMDRLYVVQSGDTSWYLCQYFTWDKLLKTPVYFKGVESVRK